MSSAITSVFNTIRSAGQAIWGPIQSAASSALGAIRSIIDGVLGAIQGVSSAIQSAMSWAGDLWNKITGASSAAASIPAGKAAPTGLGFAGGATSPSLARLLGPAPRAAAAAPTPTGTTIIVQGALFPDDAARAIDQVLRRRDRRTGGIVLT
jgi:phage-related minor tail protein